MVDSRGYKLRVDFLTMLSKFGLKSVQPAMLAAVHDQLRHEVDTMMQSMHKKVEKDLYYPDWGDQ